MLFRRKEVNINWLKPNSDLVKKNKEISFFEEISNFNNLTLPKKDFLQGLPNFSDLQISIIEQGVPSIAGLTPEQELIALLKIAAEIEHGLMIQYLYASYSCTDEGLSRTIAKIAIEEMGHLLTVQNILLALGEKPYLGRYDATTSSDFDPFPFTLEPINRKVVAKYTICEQPDVNEIDQEDKDLYEEILKEHPLSNQIKRVGILYAKIYWLLRENRLPISNNPITSPG